eukprot:XP_011679582.1 PREDICTED: beta-1,3-galactosyltransferase 1-like [Strongylocentrotus purpuratus]
MLESFSVRIFTMYPRYSVRFVAFIVLFIVAIIYMSIDRPTSCLTWNDVDTDRTHNRHRIRKMNGDSNIRSFERIPGHDYGYIHNPRNTCRGDDDQQELVFLLFLVMSTPQETKRREAIRATYANESNWPIMKEGNIRTVFLIGDVDAHDYTIQDAINGEMYYYGDIVQSTEFVDDPVNQTRKILMGFRWVGVHCRHARYVIKIDDRSMVNQRALLKHLNRKNPFLHKFILGDVVTKVRVTRDKRNWDYIPREIYPNPTLPPYIIGTGYVLSSDLAQAIYQVSHRIPVFPNTDAYVGLCLQKLGIKLTKTVDIYFSKRIGYDYIGREAIDMFDRSIVVPYVPESKMYLTWRLGQL